MVCGTRLWIGKLQYGQANDLAAGYSSTDAGSEWKY